MNNAVRMSADDIIKLSESPASDLCIDRNEIARVIDTLAQKQQQINI